MDLFLKKKKAISVKIKEKMIFFKVCSISSKRIIERSKKSFENVNIIVKRDRKPFLK